MTAKAALDLLRAGDAAGALSLLDCVAADDAKPAPLAARGMALLDVNDPGAARIALRAAVALGDTSPPTLLNLAIAEDRAGDIARARGLMQTVAEVLPQWDEPLLRLAESLRATGESALAEAAYRRVLEVNPRRAEALIALAGLLIVRAEGGEARTLLIRCLGIAPDRAEAWAALGLALLLTAEPSLAHSAFLEAQRLEPAVPEYALHGIEAARVAGQAEAEVARLTLASEADPLNPVPLLARGVLLERIGRRMEALDALDAAATLAPDALLPVKLLGCALARSHRLREAEVALRRASELDPDDPRLRNDRGTVLMRLHRHAEAHTLLSGVTAQHGEDPLVLCNLANATACLGWQEAAVSLARRAIELDPNAVLPRRALCNTLPYRDGVTGAEVLAALRDCAARLPRTDLGPCANDRTPGRRLTVGLLSGTLKTHPVGWLTVAGIETLDPARFAVVCLVQNAAPQDPIARRFRAVARDWVEIDTLDDVALATRARDLGIDVLIDLGGYGDAARMPACAHRLAPVQVKWVGMQNHSSGLPEMDWFITDRWETPPELTSIYSERLLRLPDGYVCYSPPGYAPDVLPLPALANGHITFGCFNNLAKVTPRVIATWAAVLHRVPGSRLVLKTHQFGDRADRGSIARRLRRTGHRRGTAGPAWLLAASRVHGRVWRDRHRAGPISLFRRADHLRGVVDGRPHRDAAGRDLRLPSFHEPSEQCRADRLGGARRGGLRRTGGGEGGGRGVAGGAACGAAGARQGEPAVRRAALRTQPWRRAAACLDGVVRVMNAFSSREYWEQRYRAGGTSGTGSYGHMAAFKADFINSFVVENGIADVLDLGCGDGNLLSLLQVPAYVGVDVAPTALACCVARFPQHRFLPFSALDASVGAELALSIDVIFHLVEDGEFARYMHALFAHATRFVLIHSSNADRNWSSPHVRHRRFTDHVADCRPEWRLLAHLPSRYPFDAARPDETSFSDFFVYGHHDAGCALRIPRHSDN